MRPSRKMVCNNGHIYPENEIVQIIDGVEVVKCPELECDATSWKYV